jgi:hypothetical protein
MGYRPACWRQGVQKPFQPATGQKAANSALGHEILKLFGTETQAVQYELLICLQKAAERPCIDATQSALCRRLCRYYQPPSRDCSSSTKKPAWEPKTNHRSPDPFVAEHLHDPFLNEIHRGSIHTLLKQCDQCGIGV